MNSKRRVAAIIVFAFICSVLPVYAADVSISVNTGAPIRTIPLTMYGANVASWDGSMGGGNTTFNNLMKASGCKYVRIPGGSWGNGHLWSDIEGPSGSQGWKVSYAEYLNLMTLISQPGEEVHPTLQPIVNFPGWWYEQCQDNNPTDDVCDWAQSHISAVNAAAGWVQDQTARAVCAKYWEIGNEIGGPWEVGYFPTISGTYYGDYFADFYLEMKAVNPNIKIGAVAEPTNAPQPWGWYQGLWDHDTLLAAQVKGVVPDFFIIHSYQNGGGDGSASNNPNLLGSQVDQIAQWTSNLDTIIQDTLGPQYVGQIEYCMTEWNTSAYDPEGTVNDYDRPSCYINAMFRSQYILEMAKHKWTVSNPWIYDYGANYSVFPVWYVNPMLINKFGRNMVTTYSDNSTVRAYSSIDANDNLTMFIVNNSPTMDLIAQIDISGMTIGTGGQQWIMEPAGNIIPGGLTIQDKGDISINGTVHPNPLTVNSIAPQSFTSGGSFTITLPKSCMALLRMPSIGADTTPPAAPTGLTALGGEGYISLDWNDNGEGDLASYNIYRSSTSGSGYIKQNNSPVTGSNYTDNLVLIGQTYYYIVTAVDVSWNESGYSNQASAAAFADTTPPAVPTGLTATANSGAISLNWNDNGEGDLAGYNVYRGTSSGGPYNKINVSLAVNSSYTDSGAANGMTYYYVVTAVDTVLNESNGSNEASATSIDTTPPARPTGLTAIAGTGIVTLDWDDNNEPDLAGYNIYRGTGSGGPYNILNGSTLLTSSDYIDTTVTAGTRYYYVVRARDLNTNLSGNSNQASATPTDPTPPAAPTNLTAAAGNSTVSLDWNNNSESDLMGYNVYRSITSGSGYIKLNSSFLTSSSYIDNDASGDRTYYYIVTALDTSGNESGYSNEVSASPADTIPPAVPTNLTAAAGNRTVSLNWNDNGESDLAGYNIYRSTTSGSGYSKLNGALLTSSNYTDNSVINETTYYYIITSVDTVSNESNGSSEVPATPSAWTVYTFAGINAANTNYNAYVCDVDVFPFAGLSSNRNSQVEADDANYVKIAADDTTEWTTVDPGSSDEIFLWVEMKINESPATISKIDLTFNGYTGGTAAAVHRIFVLTAGADWTLTSSWTQVGTDQSISPGTYTTMTRSITSNISNYIDGTGKITWAVYETISSEAMHVNYLETAVLTNTPISNPPAVSITSPLNGDTFAQYSNITIDADASDSDGSVTKVEFYQGAAKLGEDTTPPYSYIWNNVPTGAYTLTAIATDDSSDTTTSSNVNITVLGVQGTGAVLCEWWTGITGTSVGNLTSDINYPNNPRGKELLVTLEGPIDWADNYGTRIRGYLYPPADGNYTFWFASDDNGQLWLSTDDDPCHAVLIADVNDWTSSREWTKYTSQTSTPKPLLAGHKYYIEALQKENSGGDNIAVAWQGPGITQQVIDGMYLSPCCLEFRSFAYFAAQWNRSDCNAGNDWCGGIDFSRDGNVHVDDLAEFVDGWLRGSNF